MTQPVHPPCARFDSAGYDRQLERPFCEAQLRSFKQPFPVCDSMVRTAWVPGLSHAATKIKVDAEHPARMSEPPWLLL